MLKIYQDKILKWSRHNFSENNTPIDYNKPFKGIVEELGELSEALFHSNNADNIKDAISDITIFLLHLCAERDWDSDEILNMAYEDLVEEQSEIHSCDIPHSKFKIRYPNSLKKYQKKSSMSIKLKIGYINDNALLRKLVESVGRLSHSFLKQEEKIRGSFGCHELDAQYSTGYILIYLFTLCNYHKFDFETLLKKTWDKVSKRDWVKFPKNGITQ